MSDTPPPITILEEEKKIAVEGLQAQRKVYERYIKQLNTSGKNFSSEVAEYEKVYVI